MSRTYRWSDSTDRSNSSHSIYRSSDSYSARNWHGWHDSHGTHPIADAVPSHTAAGARDRRHARRAPAAWSDEFRCRHCKRMVGQVPWGGHHRNHCPFCLYSRHVDGATPGDRASECGSSMAPVGTFLRPNGEHVLVHRCLGCGFERHNRIAADDDFELVLSLPRLKPRLRK